jgi:thioredoxin-like negative regulator of GroEL
MKIRTVMTIAAFAAGYVLGAKAGRERYEQIRKVTNAVATNPPISKLIDESKALADAGTTKAREALSDQMHQASDSIRERAAG